MRKLEPVSSLVKTVELDIDAFSSRLNNGYRLLTNVC